MMSINSREAGGWPPASTVATLTLAVAFAWARELSLSRESIVGQHEEQQVFAVGLIEFAEHSSLRSRWSKIHNYILTIGIAMP